MSSSSQQHCRSGKYRNLMNFTKAHYDHLPFSRRKTKTENLKISVDPELKTVSRQEISAVHQKMNAVNHKLVKINSQIRRDGLHSILFDNINNKSDNQILGVILDAYNHFVRKNSRNRRYITFSSGLSKLKSESFSRNESCETAVYDGGHGSFSGFRLSRKFNFCLMTLLAVAMCFFVSCGSGSSSGGESVSNFGKLGQECYPNKTCDGTLLCDEEKNICVEDPENPIHDSDSSSNSDIENNDSDEPIDINDQDEQPINNNDSDDIIENNDKDEQPIENNDNDPIENNDNDTIENNDGDTIENNDGDNNDPTENDDSDNTPGYYYVTNDFTPEDMVMTKEELETTPQEDIDTQLFGTHDKARLRCPYNYSKNPEIYDEQGNVYVVDSCKGDLTNTKMWFENIFPKVYGDIYNLPPPASHRITYMNVDYSKAGSPSNVTIRLQNLVIDVDFLSFNCLSQATEDTSVITSTPRWDGAGCITDGNGIGFPKTQSIKQTKKVADDYISLCKTMPNYQFDEESGTCYTTIEEFVWLEKVPHKLLNQNGFSWKKIPYGIDRIDRHLDTNKFYMDMTIGYNTSSDMKVHIELNNAKSCIDQCYGKTGCTSRIEPNPDASQGCFINGEEVEG